MAVVFSALYEYELSPTWSLLAAAGLVAEAQWQPVLAVRADYRPALRGLADIYLAQQRWPELDELAPRLDATPGEAGEGAALRARALLARTQQGRRQEAT